MNIFWKSAIIRAIRTIAQTAIASIGTAAVLESVDWRFVASASVLAGILSILTSIATGLPEAGSETEIDESSLYGIDPTDEENDEEVIEDGEDA